ncbi:MAG: hypothetical protein CSA66_04630 [Proteobacteria bacterium]|nr:MAG: hypothetical protein CSA66_04630 [Pseudomonadota bacterium]
MARLDALIERWGITAVSLLGALIVLLGLGSMGLWEPWEMDRADLARTLAEPPEVAVALTEGDDALRRVVDAGARQAGAIARHHSDHPGPTRGRGARRDATGALRSALEMARTRVVAAVVLDASVLLLDPDEPTDWAAAAAKVNEALSYVPNGRVILIETREGLTLDELSARLAVERMRAIWKTAAREYELDGIGSAAEVDRAVQAAAAELQAHSRLVILIDPDARALSDALSEALAESVALVSFKDRGATITGPPLDVWLRTACYRALGVTELATRLPGALLGLLTLWLLMLTARAVWGARVATLAGLVLITTPLFYAQARLASGEPSVILALTLIAAGLLLRERAASKRMVCAYLIVGFLLAFLSKGLFGASVASALAVSVPLVTGTREPRRWLPGLAMLAATGLLALWVLGQPSDGFAGQFRFTQPLFSAGPGEHARNFDLMIRQLGFGLYPWSPLAVIGVGGLIFQAVSQQDRSGLVIVLWFALPLTALMFGQKDLNQLIWPAVPAVAVATALLLEQILARGAKSFYVAFALLLMFYIMVKEIGSDPEPLVGFLTFDPPFADKGTLRFPEALAFPSSLSLLVMLAGLLVVAHFGRLVSFARDALVYFRRGRPYAIALGLVFTLMPTIWLIRIGDAHRIAGGRVHAAVLGDTQRRFFADFVRGDEPAVLIAALTAGVLALTIVSVWVIPQLGRAFGKVFEVLLRPGPRLSFGLAAAILLTVAVVLAFSVVFPDDYWGELFLSVPSLAVYLMVALGGWLVWRSSGGDLVQVVAVVLALVALCVVVRLSRDAGWRVPGVIGPMVLGWGLLALGALPQLLERPERFAIGAGAIMGVALMGVVVPLLDRYAWIEQAIYPAETPFMTQRLLIFSKVSVLYLAVAALYVNRRFHDQLAPWVRRARVVERGPIVVAAVVAVGLLVAAGGLWGLHPALAENVSQKHVIDAYLEAEGDPDAHSRIFKHGAFAAQDRKDGNFYTAGIPEIRDRQSALSVLLGAQDQVATVEGSAGTDTRVLPGWSPANDTNRDGRRDFEAIRGFATAVSGATVTDATARWTPNALVGRTLVDINGRTWEIVANDAQRLTVDRRAPLTLSTTSPSRAFYAIDSAAVADHRATAARRARRAMLIPAGSLSDINHAFRRLSGGRHLPILDGRSYRVLLATAWLDEGETQQNRIANAVYTQASFDALTDAKVKRVWGDFDGKVRVVGYRLEQPVATKGDDYTVTVYYKSLAPLRKSYKIFMHLDLEGGGERIHCDHWPLNPTRHSEDNKSCTGCFRTDHWMPGDIVAETYSCEVPTTVASGDYNIWVGLFEPGPDKRLKVTRFEQGRARHTGDNRLGVGTFRVR